MLSLNLQFQQHLLEHRFMSVLRVVEQTFYLLSIVMLLGLSVVAQSNKGTIVGSVKDPNSALVPNAKLVLTNSSTGEAREATSGPDGTYTITNLEPGKYRLFASATGFQPLVYQEVTVETNARLPLDINFEAVVG